jgi:hypothetical protein
LDRTDVFREDLLRILDEDHFRQVERFEEMLELAGAAQQERELERYAAMEVDLESMEEGGSELHGFLHAAIALMRAGGSTIHEPFRDEFLLRRFINLPAGVQQKLAEEFWEEDADIAAILNKFLALNQAEREALLLWLDQAERRGIASPS